MNNEQQVTIESLQAQLNAANAKLARQGRKQTAGDVHVSDKGMIVMVRGLNPTTGKGQWPVTMYASDWALALSKAQEIEALINVVNN